MDALKNIRANVPDWIQRLDELSSQIDQRQVELAALGIKPTPSMKNKGSTESLKLKDAPNDVAPTGSNPPAPPATDTAVAATATNAAPWQKSPHAEPVKPTATAMAVEDTAVTDADDRPDGQPASPGSSNTPSALQKTTQQAMAIAQARARAVVKKRHRSDSIISAENTPSKYRSRSMIIVYYDSYVQGFFEELVKFVSASRNLMRKAKMAAKVAQIRRLAEMGSTDEGSSESDGLKADPAAGGDEDGHEPLPSLRYISSRRMTPGAGGPGAPRFTRAGRAGGLLGEQEKDAYDDLDKGLEFVQATCEHAAHQFLRDGDCFEEIEKVKKRLAETKALADKEYERVEREDPELLKDPADAGRARTLRPPSMRREMMTLSKDGKTGGPAATATTKSMHAATTGPPARLDADDSLEADEKLMADDHDDGGTIEADEEAKPPNPKMAVAVTSDGKLEADDDDGDAPIEADEGVQDMEIMMPPKLQFRSTRAMGRRTGV